VRERISGYADLMAGHRDVIAVGASAGGIEALRAFVAGLPADYPGAVLVVLHMPRDAPSALPGILDRSGPLPAATAVDGEPLLPGRIYVAPNDHHLLVLDEHIRLTREPAENGHRPAVDALFRSVARVFGPRAVGVVLSGSQDDGAAGLTSIVRQGGLAVVQDPADALYPWMPYAALAQIRADHVGPAAGLGSLIAMITAADLPGTPPAATHDAVDVPALEGALWAALRALDEKSALCKRMAAGPHREHTASGARFRDMADDADAAGATLRRLISQLAPTVAPPDVR
jgi:two-component system, chemotaxis family, protein-glutamate methylesterase/glutaminase